MCEVASIILFISALVVNNNFNQMAILIGLSGLFAIAGAIYSLSDKDNITVNATLNENNKK